MTEKFVIGLIGSPFGVKGFVKVRSMSGEVDHLLKLKSVIINNEGKEQVLQIAESAPGGGMVPVVLMRFAGIETPEAAKSLNGVQLLGSRDQAAPLKEGEFYIEDLKGLQVVTVNGEVVGQISDVVEGGGGELVEIELINGEKKLIPFRDEFFKEVNPNKNLAILQELWILV